ncbi:F-box domain-containing protein [Pseudomassariella vexata]|uniref:F-box domain-containing protein n=1 Tax=Pseudomassariella vexata TaxID=1141098 RepID=A0A1Y2EF76_9PEZI|nr:F-box domain-containing protein [Pseudomassariella vexata]ORY70220.1 F-box domain-containing protein [Pseudomassariella vexata]
MGHSCYLEALPDEILLDIISFLEPKDIISLQCQSRRLLKVCRDDTFWRTRCLLESSFLDGINVRRGLRFTSLSKGSFGQPLVSAALTAQERQAPGAKTSLPVDFQWKSRKALEKERIRIAANWDPTFENERVSWYDEYIQRHGPVSISWFEQPQSAKNGNGKHAIEVKGTAIYRPSQEGGALFAVSPLEDGSVCLWDIKGTHSGKGSILSKSAPGLLCVDGPGSNLSGRSKMVSSGITECVSVDSQRKRAFFAVQSHLLEVDLETLQIVGNQPYEWAITTLSAAHPSVPLTVGSFHGLHLHDSRRRSEVQRDRQERIDNLVRHNSHILSKIWETDPLPPYASLAQSEPLSILHLEQAGGKDMISDDILVAGRFSSILHYDRRKFPAITGSIHSGASLCSLASLPYPFSSVDSGLRRRGELTKEQVDTAKSTPLGGRTLIACGEYHTKGSLEVYGLSPHETSGVTLDSTMKNRQTASKSKLLSVINHGTRILVSDGQGYLKWVERDGFTEVRSTLIGHPEKCQQRSLFASMPGSGEIARKLLATQTGNDDDMVKANDDDVLFWTGERLGLVGFSPKPEFTADDFEDHTKTPEEIAAEKEEQQYKEMMRLALERQANDVRFVRYLGASIRNGV